MTGSRLDHGGPSYLTCPYVEDYVFDFYAYDSYGDGDSTTVAYAY